MSNLHDLISHAEKADALLREVRQTLDNRTLTDIFGYEFVQKLEDYFETNMEDFF